MHPLAQAVQEACPDAVLAVSEALGELTLSIAREAVRPVCQALYARFDFDHITDVTAVDLTHEVPRFEVVYHFYSISKNQRIRIKTRVPEDDASIDSICDLWKGANFLERETYDMMGIQFNGHPDLRRILMTEDYDEGFPLRKDFPVEGRGWRDRFDFPISPAQEGGS